MMHRILVGLSAVLLALPVAAQQLKSDVKFFNGFPPGGTSDLLGRMLAEAISPVVGQKVIVEQRTGASGPMAAARGLRAAVAAGGIGRSPHSGRRLRRPPAAAAARRGCCGG